MPDISGLLGTLTDLLLVLIGFGLIIFVHELGHFVAARWAGIRVLAFAIGFGPAAFSFRKGMGLRRGSSETEYAQRLMAQAAGIAPAAGATPAHAISPTEYRFNWLPFGGYVKMLGQEDLNPQAVSAAPDSYQNCVPWKKMIVISAGVVMNIITAVLLFIVVFRAGLPTEPPMVGGVAPGSQAALAEATNAKALGITAPGLQPGDEIISVDGRETKQFTDVTMAIAMTSRNTPVDLQVRRAGVAEPLNFTIMPTTERGLRLLAIGIEPPRSLTFVGSRGATDRQQFDQIMSRFGLPGVEPGAKLVAINGDSNVRYSFQLNEAARRSDGKPLNLTFENPGGKRVEIAYQPRPVFERTAFELPNGDLGEIENLAGLTGVMGVEEAAERGKKQGLADGDLFVRLGGVEFPNAQVGMMTIRAAAGKTIQATVLRKVNGVDKQVSLVLDVGRDGRVGFIPSFDSEGTTLLGIPVPREPEAATLASVNDVPEDQIKYRPTPASDAHLVPGSRVIDVGGVAVSNFDQIREQLIRATGGAARAASSATVRMTVELPRLSDGVSPGPRQQVELALSAADVKALHTLGWSGPPVSGLFESSKILLKSSGPWNAVELGLRETKRMVLQVYITFGRLFEGTLKIQHLQGPVGIAHVGTVLADRGFVWLLFFFAMVSVNLAVVNFLPLPIVDGGQFLFIVYEQIFKKPVPVGFQNAVTLAGLILIGSMFLIVTFNDITNLFRSF
ncbi:MAG: site-2 protease family protein [Planctomycetes bacterium]|nr:site-2 protease family protein [Planctomycetota bacterium]